MAFPAGLTFRDRRAEDGAGLYFQCVRSGHPAGQKRIRRAFGTRRERETYITRHDAKYHDELLAESLGIRQAPILGDVIADFMQHIQDLVRTGKRDPKTYKDYKQNCDQLLTHFGYDTPIDTINRRAGLAYAKKRRDAGSTSQGARFVKELKTVRRLQRFADLAVVWDLPTDDIGPVHMEREPIPIEDIRDFLAAMEPASLEHTFAMTKFITGLRNEELYAADVPDLSFDADDEGELYAELEYWLRNKQTGQKVRHVTHIPGMLAALLLAWIGSRQSGPLFPIAGRRLTYSSLRKRFLRASERATAARRRVNLEAPAVEITSIGQFRHEAATVAIETLEATFPATEQFRHLDERTTKKHYKLGKKAATLRQSKKFTEATESKLIH